MNKTELIKKFEELIKDFHIAAVERDQYNLFGAYDTQPNVYYKLEIEFDTCRAAILKLYSEAIDEGMAE